MTAKNETLGEKLRKLQASIRPTFTAASEGSIDVSELEKLRDQIVKLGKLYSELRGEFDAVIDFRDKGMFGADFAPSVARIRAKSDKVGRPRIEKRDELADLDI